MSGLLNKDPAIYSAEKQRFLKELKVFHGSRGTPYRHLPAIDGKEVDLYQLYWLVTAHGGWEKVNSRSGWEDLLSLFGIPETTANGALFLKQTYLRFLDAYEKIHFLGEEDEEGDSWYNGDEEDSRARRQKAQKITSTVPLTYNHAQHQIKDESREHLNLATNTYKKSDYDRLVLSLASPLPNEQDFGINVCTLLSNEGRHTLKLTKCPRLLDLILAHAGIFNHENLVSYLNQLYDDARSYDLVSFWQDVCQDDCVRKLMIKYEPRALESASQSSDDSDDIFFQGRGLGTRELAGQRILQIATIVRNLSFEEENAFVLARSATCLRFCLLCCSSQWTNLHQMGFDILSNIASELQLSSVGSEDCITHVLFSSLATCISSSDRFQVISALDVLNKLCTHESNEQLLELLLGDDKSVFQQLITYLSLHDIHLLISTLECLYSLSSLGENSCNAIVRTHGAMEALVSLITVEAQSYGPKACILMRVVETAPGVGQQQAPSSLVNLTSVPAIPAALPGQQQQGAMTQMAAAPITSRAHQQMPLKIQPNLGTTPLARGQVIQVQQRSAMHPGVTQVLIRQPANVVTNVTAGTTPVMVSQPAQPALLTTPSTTTPNNAVHQAQQPQTPTRVQRAGGSQQVTLRVSNAETNRSFCLLWLKATYESVPGESIQHEIMYKQYLASLHRLGREVINAQHYAACVRSIFGGSVGPNKRILATGGSSQYFEGVKAKVRPQPLPLKLSSQSATVTSSHAAIPANQTPGAAATPKPIAPAASPILTNLLHRKSPGPNEQPNSTPPNPTNPISNEDPSSRKVENNGTVLDGILPKSETENNKPSNGLDSKEISPAPIMVNGTGKVNGQESNLPLKRPAAGPQDPIPAVPFKTRCLEQNAAATTPLVNGGHSEAQAKAEGVAATPMSSNGVKPHGSNGHTNGINSHEPSSSVIKPDSSLPSTASNPTVAPPPPPPSATQVATLVKPNPQTPFVCEWSGCMKAFKTPKEVENHAMNVHCPIGDEGIPCSWLRCDGIKRKRYSLMTHIQDRHCHPQLMKLMAVRRVQMATTGKSEIPLPPAPPPNPGYANSGRLIVIQKQAEEFVNPKAIAMGDEKEGPVTKSIRLTSSLILKNIVVYSSLGRGRLKSFESHLSTVALSNVESSRTVSQILFEMSTEQS